jgi:hypothetical protein
VRWFVFLTIVVIANIILFYLFGTNAIPVETFGPIVVTEYVIAQWFIVIWLVRKVLRWFIKQLSD